MRKEFFEAITGVLLLVAIVSLCVNVWLMIMFLFGALCTLFAWPLTFMVHHYDGPTNLHLSTGIVAGGSILMIIFVLVTLAGQLGPDVVVAALVFVLLLFPAGAFLPLTVAKAWIFNKDPS